MLLFLLSRLARTQNRTRLAVVGFTFFAISGILYFVFMAAWLNLFLVAGHLKWITAVAGAVAIVLALVNLKEYARPGSRGPLSISESAKPKLYNRIRSLIAGDRILPILEATVVLAIVVNS